MKRIKICLYFTRSSKSAVTISLNSIKQLVLLIKMRAFTVRKERAFTGERNCRFLYSDATVKYAIVGGCKLIEQCDHKKNQDSSARYYLLFPCTTFHLVRAENSLRCPPLGSHLTELCGCETRVNPYVTPHSSLRTAAGLRCNLITAFSIITTENIAVLVLATSS